MTPGPADRKLNSWELGAALVLFAIGAFLTWTGLGYSVGTVRHMGPGFFPVAVGIVLMMLSAAIMLEVRHSKTPAPTFSLRPLVATVVGLAAFGALIEPVGLVPATFVLVFVASYGDSAMSTARAVIVAAAVAAMGYAVFVLGFRLPIHPFWW